MATATAADTEVRAAFRALLTAERAGYKLATALVSNLVTYLVVSVELSDVSELDFSDLLTTAEEAWASTHEGEELPNVHRQRLMRWVANVPASISVEGDNAVALSPRRLLTNSTTTRCAPSVSVDKYLTNKRCTLYSSSPTIYYRPAPPDNSGRNIAAETLVGASRCKDGWGGQLQSHEVGMSSMGAAPPARQPWRGSAAPCHGRLGAWDIHPLALGRQSAGGGYRQWGG